MSQPNNDLESLKASNFSKNLDKLEKFLPENISENPEILQEKEIEGVEGVGVLNYIKKLSFNLGMSLKELRGDYLLILNEDNLDTWNKRLGFIYKQVENAKTNLKEYEINPKYVEGINYKALHADFDDILKFLREIQKELNKLSNGLDSYRKEYLQEKQEEENNKKRPGL